MSRVKLIMLASLAILVASAVGSAAASAAECPEAGGTVKVLCIEKKATTGSIAFTDEKKPGTESLLEVKAIGLHIVCKKAVSEGTIDAPVSLGTIEVLTTKLEFSECEVLEHPNCKVTEPIVVKPLNSPLNNSTNEVTFVPTTGTEFVTIVIKNKSETEKCGVLAASYKVTGSQTCSLPEAETEKAEHQLTCLNAGSKLKAGENEALFQLEENFKLSGTNLGKSFSLQKG